MSRGLAVLFLLVLAISLFASGCRLSRPFRGPGYDPDLERLRSDLPESLLVAITAGRIESGASQTFSEDLTGVEERLEKSPGLVGYALRRELFGRKVWTLSIWESPAALRRFAMSAEHTEAIRRDSIPEAKTLTLQLPRSELPLSWDKVDELLARSQ